MAKISEPLSDFLPQLPQLEGIVRRLGENSRQSWPAVLERLGEAAIDSVRWAIYDSGIKSRSGYLMDQVKFDISGSTYGDIEVDAIYASVLDQGMNMKMYLMNRVIGMDYIQLPGSIFRTVSDKPTKTGKNWTIEPHNFMELAKSRLQQATIQFVDKLEDLASPESADNYVMPVEELPELSEEKILSFFMEVQPRDEIFQQVASAFTATERAGSDIEATEVIGEFEEASTGDLLTDQEYTALMDAIDKMVEV